MIIEPGLVFFWVRWSHGNHASATCVSAQVTTIEFSHVCEDSDFREFVGAKPGTTRGVLDMSKRAVRPGGGGSTPLHFVVCSSLARLRARRASYGAPEPWPGRDLAETCLPQVIARTRALMPGTALSARKLQPAINRIYGFF